MSIGPALGIEPCARTLKKKARHACQRATSTKAPHTTEYHSKRTNDYASEIKKAGAARCGHLADRWLPFKLINDMCRLADVPASPPAAHYLE